MSEPSLGRDRCSLLDSVPEVQLYHESSELSSTSSRATAIPRGNGAVTHLHNDQVSSPSVISRSWASGIVSSLPSCLRRKTQVGEETRMNKGGIVLEHSLHPVFYEDDRGIVAAE